MPRSKRLLLFRLGALLLAVLIALPLTGVVKIFRIPTSSMSPTAQAGDMVLATRIFNPGKKVKKGDVVVFDGKLSKRKDISGEYYLTRVVASAGDKVGLVDDELRVNGVALPERDGQKARRGRPDPRYAQPAYPFVVPADSVFTVGDNYDNSLDGRYFGILPIESITHSGQRVVSPPKHAKKIE